MVVGIICTSSRVEPELTHRLGALGWSGLGYKSDNNIGACLLGLVSYDCKSTRLYSIFTEMYYEDRSVSLFISSRLLAPMALLLSYVLLVHCFWLVLVVCTTQRICLLKRFFGVAAWRLM